MIQWTDRSEIGTAVLCAKFQADWTIETDVMDERDFARFEFKMSFGRISYITQYPSISIVVAYTHYF